MKKTFYTFTLIGLLVTTTSLTVTAEEHHHYEENTTQLMLNQEEKWAIDESLHLGMSNIKHELEKNLMAIHHENFSTEQYITLATTMEQELRFLFENCKLEPQADAQLHILLSKIMQGIDIMKNAEHKKQGGILIIQALRDYPLYFNDLNWQSLVH
ncbi:hypothetical protein AAD001_14250 [Colwelliaceae bacterium 6471]